MLLGGFHVEVVHGLDGAAVLRDHALGGAAALVDVALQAPDEALVRRGVHEHLEVHAPPQLRGVEYQDALHYQYRGRLGEHGVVGPVVQREVVDGAVHGPTAPQVVHVLHQELRVEGAGLVVVGPLALLERQAALRAVVSVLRQEQGVGGAGRLDHRPCHRGLAGTGAARQTDDQSALGLQAAPSSAASGPTAPCSPSWAARSAAARMKPVKGGEGRMRRDLNSGCDCRPMKKGWSCSSTASTRPSPRPAMPGVTPATTSPACLSCSTYSGFTS